MSTRWRRRWDSEKSEVRREKSEVRISREPIDSLRSLRAGRKPEARGPGAGIRESVRSPTPESRILESARALPQDRRLHFDALFALDVVQVVARLGDDQRLAILENQREVLRERRKRRRPPTGVRRLLVDRAELDAQTHLGLVLLDVDIAGVHVQLPLRR